jgi:hypothetical protein
MATTVRARPDAPRRPRPGRPSLAGRRARGRGARRAGFRLLGARRQPPDTTRGAFTAWPAAACRWAPLRVRAHDSTRRSTHLLHLPSALGVSAFWFRMPGVLCSIAAWGCCAWWMRSRRVGCWPPRSWRAHVRDRPRPRGACTRSSSRRCRGGGAGVRVVAGTAPAHAYLPGILVLLGLLTHVSMFLVGAGLLALPGRRRDCEAWRWRVRSPPPARGGPRCGAPPSSCRPGVATRTGSRGPHRAAWSTPSPASSPRTPRTRW